MERLIAMGAEAKVYESEFLGIPAIRKVRIPKPYRVKELDEELRRRRTAAEARAYMRAKEFGVPCPAVLDIHGAELILEKIEGEVLRDILGSLNDEEVSRVAEQVGRIVARLHKAGIVHNDLTGVNIIVSPGLRVSLIDLGLSSFSVSTEDRAVDLHVLKQSLKAVEPKRAEAFFSAFCSAYSDELGEEAREVLSRLRKVEERGRYK